MFRDIGGVPSIGRMSSSLSFCSANSVKEGTLPVTRRANCILLRERMRSTKTCHRIFSAVDSHMVLCCVCALSFS
jgi:hypothetical protein